jgi:hypothetical protein
MHASPHRFFPLTLALLMSFSALSALIAKAVYGNLGDPAIYTPAASPGAPISTRVIIKFTWEEGLKGQAPDRVVKPTDRHYLASFPIAASDAGASVTYAGVPLLKRGDLFTVFDKDGITVTGTYEVQRMVEQDLDESRVLVKPV